MSSRFLILPQSHNDSVLGLASVIDAMVILGLVLNNCSDTANRAADITCNATRVSKENPMGWIGLKRQVMPTDRKSTRLNSSHVAISYAVFCLKKKIRIIIYLT